HTQVPFGSLFGDEDYFIKRSLWMRNVALGIPVHMFDLEYAFEPNGRSIFLNALAAIQWLTGPAPYGLHLVSVWCSTVSALIVYRLVRPGFGRVAALIGLALLLFLPSLFTWSIAVLKEPPFTLISALILALSVAMVREGSWLRRALALAGIVALAAVQDSLRPYGGLFSVASVAGGLALAFVVT